MTTLRPRSVHNFDGFVRDAAPLLFQWIVPVDDAQVALTRMCLAGISESLMTYFLASRAETDAALEPFLASVSGKLYPYGRCRRLPVNCMCVC